jgi:DNA replication licensing factor MCM4
MMSNFQKKRGYMDVNRMLKAPTFNPGPRSDLQMGAPQQMSSTVM